MFVKFVRAQQFLVFSGIGKQYYCLVKRIAFSPPAAKAAFPFRDEGFAAIFTGGQSPCFRKFLFDLPPALVAESVPCLIKGATGNPANGAALLKKEFPQEKRHAF